MRKFVVGFAWFLVLYGMVGVLGGIGFSEVPYGSSAQIPPQTSTLISPSPSPSTSTSLSMGLLLLVTAAALSAIGTLTGSLPGTSDFASARGWWRGDR